MTVAMEQKTTMTIISKWTIKKMRMIDYSVLCLFCIIGILTWKSQVVLQTIGYKVISSETIPSKESKQADVCLFDVSVSIFKVAAAAYSTAID